MYTKYDKSHPATVFFSNHHPLAKYVDFEFLETSKDALLVRVKAPAYFKVSKSSSKLHSGYVTILLDSLLGGVVFGALETPTPIATVSLSTHHLRKPFVSETLLVKSRCIGIYREQAYVEGSVEVEDSGEVIATANGTFMIGTRSTSIREVKK